MLRDTAAQDRLIERPSLWKRHRLLLAASLAAAAAVCVLVGCVLRYSGTGASVDRAQLSIAAVERGSFVRATEDLGLPASTATDAVKQLGPYRN